MSTTNISFFNIEKDEVLDLDFNKFVDDNKINKTIAKGFNPNKPHDESKYIHKDSYDIPENIEVEKKVTEFKDENNNDNLVILNEDKEIKEEFEGVNDKI